MEENSENLPNPKEIEKEIGEFLAKKFGGTVRMITPATLPESDVDEEDDGAVPSSENKLKFNTKPKELISYLDEYIVKQDQAKAVLATKICTHFNRITRTNKENHQVGDMVGSIKNNVMMIGPTGVGKTYIIKLIANKIGVPFVKGDATKFSETGYVGGDVEDLVRELVREADDDIELAQCGIIYIDEIDKIAASRNLIGADISRTGVQRALLKPLEETDIDLKVPHDPISMIQEMERFRKTGERDKRTVNTKNILFIMSGAFGDLPQIVNRRLTKQAIGFGADITTSQEQTAILHKIKSEDLIEYGFESEFVGRLPVRSIFEHLNEDDLYTILKNPNNPIILGKKLDFAAYGIDIRFEDAVLRIMAGKAFQENTGARGLVSAVESILLPFETQLPSSPITQFPVTTQIIEHSAKAFLQSSEQDQSCAFAKLVNDEREFVKEYLIAQKQTLAAKYNILLTDARIDTSATFYSRNIIDIDNLIKQLKTHLDEIKKVELYFFKRHDVNIVFEEDAIDYIIEQLLIEGFSLKRIYRKLINDFELGLKLIMEKTRKNRFFISREALLNPDVYISELIKNELNELKLQV
ncbi:AAA family ATPase [Desulfococcaceae bacterium HSG7]|nr:AAA family ATPase [Desulfococcaceae bacterium HSG7]